MTMTQKILASHAGLYEVSPGMLINAKVDMVLGNDITSPLAIREFFGAGFKRVFDPAKIALVMDHFTPCKDIRSAEMCKTCRDFAGDMGIDNFFDVGCMGIEHALLPEKGLVAAGELVVGADSHTCTYGALGAFSTGVGSTDMAAAMATGELWFKVPEAVRVNLTGRARRYVGGKDVILHLIGLIGVDGASYKSLEFGGEGLSSLAMDDRFTMANMAIEAGAKNGIFETDAETRAYMAGRVSRPCREYLPDADAAYCRTLDIDLSSVQPTAAFPHLPENVRTADNFGDIRIDQVVIGSCTNGRLGDLRTAAEIMRGKKAAKGVRVIVIPATQQIYRDALKAGYIDDLLEAGCAISTPTCGPCIGGHMGVLAAGERCVATTNRNFVGRMGHTESEIYLAGPAVAAASALTGRLTSPYALCEGGVQNES